MRYILGLICCGLLAACDSTPDGDDTPNPITEVTTGAPYEGITDTIAMSGSRFLYSKDKSKTVLTGSVDVLVLSADSAVVVLTDEVRSVELRGTGSKLYYTRVKPDYELGVVELNPSTTVDTIPISTTSVPNSLR